MTNDRRHPLNTPGCFYVRYGCCTACGVPEWKASELFEQDNDNHCFVKRQPQSADELDQMLEVISISELDCIRYAGIDKNILQRLSEILEIERADNAPAMLKFRSWARHFWWRLLRKRAD